MAFRSALLITKPVAERAGARRRLAERRAFTHRRLPSSILPEFSFFFPSRAVQPRVNPLHTFPAAPAFSAFSCVRASSLTPLRITQIWCPLGMERQSWLPLLTGRGFLH
jgi:hypothetical protein